MIKLTPFKNSEQAKSYFSEHLAVDDYYSEPDSATGAWVGDGAVRLSQRIFTDITISAPKSVSILALRRAP